MKIAVFLLTAVFLHAQASTTAQMVTLSGKDLSVKNVIAIIKKQTGYFVLCSKADLESTTSVSLSVQNMPLTGFLELLLKSQPLEYTIEGKAITLSKRTRPSHAAPTDFTLPSLWPFKGRVQSEDGAPAANVSVTIKGSSTGTFTDANGYFTLDLQEGQTLVLSSVAFRSKELKVTKQLAAYSDQPFVISLAIRTAILDETVVIPYGTTSKRLSTGNVSTVTASDIEKQPIGNPILALQGRVPGVTVNQTSGNAGANVTVRIQGQNSIAQGNDPFYVIDGVPYLAQNQASLSSAYRGGSPLSFLSPGSIESITVLKDADATSIYGSRAANGAIIITTKKGANGKTKIDASVQHGFSQNIQESKLLNTEQYIAITKEGFLNDGITPGSPEYTSAYAVNGTYDANRNINWQKELAGKAAGYSDYQLSFSGGGSNTTFLAGANYHKEKSVYPGSFSDSKKSVQFSLTNHTTDNKFNFLLSANYINDDNGLPRYNLYSQALWLAPNAPELYNADGSLNWGQLPDGTVTFRNPLSNIMQKYVVKSNNLIANSVISYQIIQGLTIKSSFGYDRLESNENFINPMSSIAPDYRQSSVATAQQSARNTENWIIEPQITFKRKISNGTLDMLLGSTFQHSNADLLSIQGSGFTNDNQLTNLKSAPTISIVNTDISKYIYNALFGRLSYAYREKLITNFTLRRDGSSRFGVENKFNTFYSVAGGYIFTEENFIKEVLGLMSYGKLKVSYGTSGSDQIPNYSYLSLYRNTGGAIVPYQGLSTIYPSNINNQYLKWERTNKLNVGLDLGFIQNRVLLSVNYYQNNSSNQLVRAPLPYLTGFNFIMENLPATVRNAGWELSLDMTAINRKKFKWSSSLNFTIPRNKLVSFPNLDANPSYRNSLVVGQPLNVNKLYNYQGVNPQTGLYQFLSSTDKLTSNPSYLIDNYLYASPFPKYYGGFQNSFVYGQFQFDFLLQYVHQKVADYLFGDGPGSNLNSPAFVAGNRWTAAGQTADVQKVSNQDDDVLTALSDVVYSTANYQSGSYLRLKNASLSYTMPGAAANFLGLRDLKIYILGQNLFTVTKLNQDPETTSYSLPALRVITAGINIGIN